LGLGISEPPLYRLPERPSPWVYYLDHGVRLYYDKSLGLMVHSDTESTPQPDGDYVTRRVTTYAGPDGVSEEPNDKLGRFFDPVAGEARQPWIMYDRKLRRFFAIDWHHKTVRKGPPLAEDASNRPVQIGLLGKNKEGMQVAFTEPMIKDIRESPASSDADANTPDERFAEPAEMYGQEYLMDMGMAAAPRSAPLVPLVKTSSYGFDAPLTFVLDASGRIDLLDRDTLEIVGRAGVLPVPNTLLPYKDHVGPADVLAYAFTPVFVGEERTYAGCAVATVSREATAMSLAIFDPNGKCVGKDSTGAGYKRGRHGGSSAWEAYFGLPGAPLLTGLEYITESLHPPVLLFASYLTASSFEATAGYRSLFLLPNSFPAMAGRNMSAGPLGRFLSALAFMTLAFGLAGVFVGHVVYDCTRIGISRQERLLWIIATLLFGLPAYLTYRLTRPRTTLVTCDNCGRRRRPDMDKCHRCGSPWDVPELTPPVWRVLDDARPIGGAAPDAVEQQASTMQ
jgi:hypothetical protein